MIVEITKKVSGTSDHFLGKAIVPVDGREVELKNVVVKQTESKAELVVVSDIPTQFGGQPVKGYKGGVSATVEAELKKGSAVDFKGVTIVHKKLED